MGALGGDETLEEAPARHDDQAVGPARQQRAHMLRGTGVVQDDQYAPLGQQTAVEGGLLVHADRHAPRRDAECVQEGPQGLTRRAHEIGRGETPQIDVQLTVRVAVGDPVGHMQGKAGLADACHPADRADHHRCGAARPGDVGHQREDAVDLRLPAGEPSGQRGELTGPDHRYRRRPRRRCAHAHPEPVTSRAVHEGTRAGTRHASTRAGTRARPAAEHLRVGLAERGPRVDAQLVGEPPPDLAVELQGLGLSAGAGQYGDQPRLELLLQWVLFGRLLEGDAQAPRGVRLQRDVRGGRDGVEILAVDRGERGQSLYPGRDSGRHLAASQRERLDQQLHRCLRRAPGVRLAGVCSEFAKAQQVE